MKKLIVLAMALGLAACSKDASADKSSETRAAKVAAAKVAAAKATHNAARDLPSLDTVLARHYAALGGEHKLRKAKTLMYAGTSYKGDSKVTIAKYYTRGGKVRIEKTGDKGEKVMVVNGDKAWKAYDGEVHEITGEKMSSMKRMATMDDALLTYKRDGYRVSLEGQKSVKGKPAYELKLVMNDETELRYIDAASYYEVKRVMSWTGKDGKPGSTSMYFSDYRDIGDGMMLNHRVDYESDKGTGKFIIESASYNQPIAAAKYAKPTL